MTVYNPQKHPKLVFVTNSNNTARLGTFYKLKKSTLKKYVRLYSRAWIEA